MSDPASAPLAAFAVKACRNELTDYTVYARLAAAAGRNTHLRDTLSSLAETEKRHLAFWKKYTMGAEPKVNRLKVRLVLLLRRLLGTTFVVKYLERAEKGAGEEYRRIAALVPAEDQTTLRQIIADEEEHEGKLMAQIEDARVKYISFIVLGLADALVEIAGIHAGSLGIYDVTRVAGLAGIVAGAAASIAMASAAYAQAKQGFQGSAGMSAVYTGVSYFVTAVVLATPYFFTENMVLAMLSSLFAGIFLVAFIAYYSAVISGSVFKKDFAEITAIMLGATIALYLLGSLIRYGFGIRM